MHVDTTKAEDYVGMIVYKSFNPKTLYVIESVKEVKQFDVAFYIKGADGETETASSLRLKCFNTLVEETETKLKNHQARLWFFKKKLGLE